MEQAAKNKKKSCYYKVLGIPVRASQEQIRRAFRYYAMKLHPDHNPGNPAVAERFREVLTAYETLNNPVLRGRYDRLKGYKKPKRKPAGSWTDLHQDDRGEAASFDEIFQDLFGIGRREARTHHGCDLRFDIQVARSSLGAGFFEEINYERVVFCRNCRGNGTGRAECGECGGKGERVEVCALRVWIPPDIKDGMRIRVAGGGDFSFPAHFPGDLVVLVNIIESC